MSGRSAALSRPAYRADVDGLRAVAVLLVVCNHYRIHFTGGYVGVDIFFVISGYLISGIVMGQMESGRFSIVDFYERRIRRIFPALLVVLAATTAMAWHYLFPSEIVGYAKSLFTAIFSCSNLEFWHEASYFDEASSLKPLLHTWSLAVEEQFYIMFPIALLLIRRFLPGRMKAAILVLAGVSFAFACVIVRHDPTQAFFSAPLRAWELLAGTILSQRYLPSIRGLVARNAASAAGLGLIMVPAMLYTPFTMFPGLAALAPCLGSCLIIAAGETGTSLVGRGLALRPVVFVGLISYSLYLWHWPIAVFQVMGHMLTPASAELRSTKLLMLAVSFVLAVLSWAFVETPFRKGRFRPARRPLFWIAGSGVAAMCVMGAQILGTHGDPGRFPASSVAMAQYLDYKTVVPFREGSCFITDNFTFSGFDKSACLPHAAGKEHVVLIGDSHGAALWTGLQAAFPGKDIGQITSAGCQPLPTLKPTTERCAEMIRYVFDEYLPAHPGDTAIFAARWSADETPEIAKLVAWAHERGLHFVLIGPNVEYDVPLPRLLAATLSGRDASALTTHVTEGQSELDQKLGTLARETWHVPYISFFENLCTPQGSCPAYASPETPLLFDSNHMTAMGSALFGRSIRDRGLLP